MGGSPGDVNEEPVSQEKRKKSWRMSCDVGEATDGLKNDPHSPTLTSLHLRHRSFSNHSAALPTSQLILQPFRCFTYVTAHSPTLPPLHLRHSSFYNPYAASPKSQVILQPFHCFTYVTDTSRTSLGEPPMHRGMKKQLWWTSLLQQVISFG